MNPARDLLAAALLVVGLVLSLGLTLALVLLFGMLMGHLLYVIGGVAIALFACAWSKQPAFIRETGPTKISSREILAALRRRG